MQRTARIDVQPNDFVGKQPAPIGPTRINVLIAEDDPLVREALALIIGDDDAFEVVGLASDADEAISVALKLQPDLALLDVRMPGGGGAHAAQAIEDLCPGVHIVAISAHDDQQTVGEMVSAGARGYITKDSPPAQMLDTLRRCAAGESIFTPVSATSLMGEYAKSSRRMEEAKRERREREARLREICEPGSIESVFQPIVNLATCEVEMYEALTRFNTPHELSTMQWFEEAVGLGLSSELELAALAGTVAAVRQTGRDDITISVNVSPDTLLNPALAPTLSSLAPERLVIEITEYAQIADYAQTKRALARLHDRGTRMAIDDAGAGFASLRHILDLMPDLIKLDISLVRGIDTDQPRRALATGLISFAQEIEAAIVAEGIETQAELDCVRDLGVQYGQGYILARPAPLDELLEQCIELSG